MTFAIGDLVYLNTYPYMNRKGKITGCRSRISLTKGKSTGSKTRTSPRKGKVIPASSTNPGSVFWYVELIPQDLQDYRKNKKITVHRKASNLVLASIAEKGWEDGSDWSGWNSTCTDCGMDSDGSGWNMCPMCGRLH
jgi:hypothetical protein